MARKSALGLFLKKSQYQIGVRPQLLTEKKDRFTAHSQQFLAKLKGLANAQQPLLSIRGRRTIWPSAKDA